MSLFSFGFTTAVADKRLPSYIPKQRESGLGREEHDSVTAAIEDLANPAAKKIKRGKYAKYSDEQRAQIGKYACEHGNTNAQRKFLSGFPNLNESTVDLSRSCIKKR